MEALPRAVVVSEDEIRSGQIDRVLKIVISLMASPDAIEASRQGLTMQFEVDHGDPMLEAFLRKLHIVWPLWLHFVTPETLGFVVQTLVCPHTTDSPREAILDFLSRSMEVVGELYSVYGISGDTTKLMRDALEHFERAGILQPTN